MRRLLAAVAVVAIALPLSACGGAQTRTSENHACTELKPLLADGDQLTAQQTKDAVTAVHSWSSQVIDDDGFEAAGQALYTAYQRSNTADFDAAVKDLGDRCAARAK